MNEAALRTYLTNIEKLYKRVNGEFIVWRAHQDSKL